MAERPRRHGRGLTVYAYMVRKLRNYTPSRSSIRRVAVLLAGVAAVGTLLGLARAYATFPGDEWGLREVAQWRTAWLHNGATALSAIGAGGIGLGGTAVPWIPVLAVGGLLALRRWAEAALLSLAVLAAVVNLGLKELAARPRPDAALALVEETGYGFPSGHAVFAAAFFGALLALPERWGWLRGRPVLLWGVRGALAALVIGVGWSRVYLGVHWPSDVVAGWLVGILSVGIVVAGEQCVNTVRKRRGEGSDQ